MNTKRTGTKQAAALDPRLVNFDWEGRKAAPVERLMEPHAHFSGNRTALDTLAGVLRDYHVECVFLISGADAGKEWFREVERRFVVGRSVIPFYWMDLRQNNPDSVQKAYDLGFWGLKFICPAHAYDDRFYDPLYAKAQELKMPVLFHVGLLGKGKAAIAAGCGMSLMRADMLDTIASRFPDLLIQGAHLASPNIAEAVCTTLYSPNLMWDASGGCRHLLQVNPLLLAAPLQGRPGVWRKLMWSTDTVSGKFSKEHAAGWSSQYEYQLAIWQDILSRLPTPPTTEELDGFFYGNAKRRMDDIIARRTGGKPGA